MPESGREHQQNDVEWASLLTRGRFTGTGVISEVTLPPAGAPPRLHVVLQPEHSSVQRRLHVVWLGQRRITGIRPGAMLKVSGMVSRHNGVPTMFNPEYEL